MNCFENGDIIEWKDPFYFDGNVILYKIAYNKQKKQFFSIINRFHGKQFPNLIGVIIVPSDGHNCVVLYKNMLLGIDGKYIKNVK